VRISFEFYEIKIHYRNVSEGLFAILPDFKAINFSQMLKQKSLESWRKEKREDKNVEESKSWREQF